MKVLLENLFNNNSKMPLLKVRLANSPKEQQHGLMYVKSMNENHGMLFRFSREQTLNFWGQNTHIPLDIAFVDKNGIIRKISYIKPMSEKIISSELPSIWAIEANAGYFDKNNICIGDKILLHKTSEGNYLSFHKKRRNIHIKSENYNLRNIFSQIDSLNKNDVTGENNVEDINSIDGVQNEPVGQEDLPVIDVSDINNILEDNIEDQNELEKQQPTQVLDQNWPQEQVNEEQFEYPVFGNIFDAYKWAEENNEIMNIIYTTEKGRTINRQIEPHGHFYAKTTNRQIFVVFDRTVGDIRAFIMINIGSFSFAKDRFIKKFRLN